jgi:hypothetical protein
MWRQGRCVRVPPCLYTRPRPHAHAHTPTPAHVHLPSSPPHTGGGRGCEGSCPSLLRVWLKPLPTQVCHPATIPTTPSSTAPSLSPPSSTPNLSNPRPPHPHTPTPPSPLIPILCATIPHTPTTHPPISPCPAPFCQVTEEEVLRNSVGSVDYQWFMHELGSLVRLKDAPTLSRFVGGLDTVWANDGEFALCWHNDVCQVVFHTATMMPGQAAGDGPDAVKRATINKKRHIGNDNVLIAFLEEGGAFAVCIVAASGLGCFGASCGQQPAIPSACVNLCVPVQPICRWTPSGAPSHLWSS